MSWLGAQDLGQAPPLPVALYVTRPWSGDAVIPSAALDVPRRAAELPRAPGPGAGWASLGGSPRMVICSLVTVTASVSDATVMKPQPSRARMNSVPYFIELKKGNQFPRVRPRLGLPDSERESSISLTASSQEQGRLPGDAEWVSWQPGLQVPRFSDVQRARTESVPKTPVRHC